MLGIYIRESEIFSGIGQAIEYYDTLKGNGTLRELHCP